MRKEIYNSVAKGFYSEEIFEKFISKMPGAELIFSSFEKGEYQNSSNLLINIYHISPEGVTLKTIVEKQPLWVTTRRATLFGKQKKINKIEQEIKAEEEKYKMKGVEAKL